MNQQGVLARFPTRQAARATWDKRSSVRFAFDGTEIPRLPMISGFKKTDYILWEPFGTYWGAFRRAATLSPLWLIVGYGGGDPHVNACLQSAMLQSVSIGHVQGMQHAFVIDYFHDLKDHLLDLHMEHPVGKVLAEKFFIPWASADILSSRSHQYLQKGNLFRKNSFNRIAKHLSVSLDGTDWGMSENGTEDFLKRAAEFLNR